MFSSANQSLSLLLLRRTTWNVYNSLAKYGFQNVTQCSVNLWSKTPRFNFYLIPFFLALIEEGFNQWRTSILLYVLTS